ncbi:hypothetical protein B0H12DRAFT_1231041 [Mycena haematopus]|nr:hypothetical protein B0H12DRAFT_1231041 [Mycena haematopus]
MHLRVALLFSNTEPSREQAAYESSVASDTPDTSRAANPVAVPVVAQSVPTFTQPPITQPVPLMAQPTQPASTIAQPAPVPATGPATLANLLAVLTQILMALISAAESPSCVSSPSRPILCIIRFVAYFPAYILPFVDSDHLGLDVHIHLRINTTLVVCFHGRLCPKRHMKGVLEAPTLNTEAPIMRRRY